MNPRLRERTGCVLILLLGAAGTMVLVLQGAIPQDPAYHDFADKRTILGIPNFWNVASNLPFLLAGIAGLYCLRPAAKPVIEPGLRRAWWLLYAGVALLAFGSSWYHLWPDNNSLVWDRLAMTIGFMALFSVIIGEFFSIRAGRTPWRARS